MKTYRIMVIDDEKIVGDMSKAVLEKEGYLVETFLSAEPALAKLKEEKFDIVITDLKMKAVDGMEVLSRIKAESPEVKVIMITAFANLNAAIEAIKKKVDDFFTKPVKFKDLKDSIRHLLGEPKSAL